jgi:hypothetical protein
MTGTHVIVIAWGERLKQTHSMKEGSTLNERRWERRMKEKLQHSGGGQGLEAGLRPACMSMACASAAEAQGASSCRPSIARSCSSACCHRPSPPDSTSSRPTASLFHNAFQNPAALTMECSAPLLAANSVSSRTRHGECAGGGAARLAQAKAAHQTRCWRGGTTLRRRWCEAGRCAVVQKCPSAIWHYLACVEEGCGGEGNLKAKQALAGAR